MKVDIRTLLPIARPKPHGTAPASTSPTCFLRFFLTLIDNSQYKMRQTIKFMNPWDTKTGLRCFFKGEKTDWRFRVKITR